MGTWHALQLLRVRAVLRRPVPHVLAPGPVAAGAECAAPGGGLLLLLPVGRTLPLALDPLDRDGLRLRALGRAGGGTPQAQGGRRAEHGPEPRSARLLQILQFF